MKLTKDFKQEYYTRAARKWRFNKVVRVFFEKENLLNALKDYILKYSSFLKSKKELKESFDVLRQNCRNENVRPPRFGKGKDILFKIESLKKQKYE